MEEAQAEECSEQRDQLKETAGVGGGRRRACRPLHDPRDLDDVPAAAATLATTATPAARMPAPARPTEVVCLWRLCRFNNACCKSPHHHTDIEKRSVIYYTSYRATLMAQVFENAKVYLE